MHVHVCVYEFVLKCDIEIIAYSCIFEWYSAVWSRTWGSISSDDASFPSRSFWRISRHSVNPRLNLILSSKWTIAFPVREHISVANLIIPTFFTSRRWYVDYAKVYSEIRPLIMFLFFSRSLGLAAAGWKSTRAWRLMTGNSTLLIARTFITRLIQLRDYEHLTRLFFFVN